MITSPGKYRNSVFICSRWILLLIKIFKMCMHSIVPFNLLQVIVKKCTCNPCHEYLQYALWYIARRDYEQNWCTDCSFSLENSPTYSIPYCIWWNLVILCMKYWKSRSVFSHWIVTQTEIQRFVIPYLSIGSLHKVKWLLEKKMQPSFI